MAENKHRWKIQLAATLASNPFFLNFFEGKIHKGRSKMICVPGLNCYSCPAAAASCPIGSLQAVIGSSKFHFALLYRGIADFDGCTAGTCHMWFSVSLRMVSGAAAQDPFQKIKRQKAASAHLSEICCFGGVCDHSSHDSCQRSGIRRPVFCKYICPVGILEGGIPLSIADSAIRASLGALFTWKSCILLGCMVLFVFFYRPFCKWLCPLGAFYALLNSVSLYRFHIDTDKCTSCGACSKVCKMDVDVFRTPNHRECIRCGDCVRTCPHQAITRTFSLKSTEGKKVKTHEKNS